MKGHFEFVITAEDKVGHIDAAKVQIYLLREDQRVRFVVRGQPKEIRSEIDEFRNRLSNITDSIGKYSFEQKMGRIGMSIIKTIKSKAF